MIQREIEKAGIATISVTQALKITKSLKAPRSVYLGFPLGHPLSFPGQSFRQLSVLRLLLKHLEQIRVPGTIVEQDETESNDPKIACEACV